MAMELDHSFTVPVPPDQAWDVLLDVQRIARACPARRSTRWTATTWPGG